MKSDIDSDTLSLPQNFDFIRRDRPTDTGRGGCGILVSKNINAREVPLELNNVSINKIEAIWLEIKQFKIYVCCFYRSNNYCPVDAFLEYMTQCMMKLNNKKVIWIGDINIDQNNIRDTSYRKLDITMKSFGMVQTIRDMTRVSYIRNTITQSTIDVIITNCYSDFNNCTVLDEKIGDHQAIKCELNFRVTKPNKFRKILIRDHSIQNLEKFANFLDSSNFDHILKCDDINMATENLTQYIENYYDIFCPIKSIKCHNNYLYKPSKQLLDAIKKKRILYRKFKKHRLRNSAKCEKIWDEYKKQKNFVTKLSKLNKRQNVINDLKAKSIKNDLKGIWKTIKKASNISPCKTDSNIGDNIDPEINTFFSTIGSKIQSQIPKHDNDNFKDYIGNEPECEMSTFEEITENCVLDYIKGLSNDKSINDCIPIKIFKIIIPIIVEPFTHIINLSLKHGIMPESCKKAMVTPIYKAGDPSDPGNYRPISILPILGKAIESFINEQLMNYIDENKILTMQQYGFRKNYSTTFLMLDLFDKIYAAKEKNKKPAIVFLDIKKAFDTVNHQILIQKLKHYGLKGSALNWFKNFLSNRYQQTKIGKLISTPLLVESGVPQGSILGPLLFSLYINDITKSCKNSIPFLFADDGALYFDNVKRGSYLNIKNEMVNIHTWLRVNKLSLNVSKTSFIVFDHCTNMDTIKLNVNSDSNIEINECKTQKYLGLIVDHKLKFLEHVEYIKKKVAKRIGAMYRSKNLLPLKFRKMFANALMLPQFDYLDIVWCKAGKTKLNELDILYKKVAKIALNVDKRESSLKVYEEMKWLPLHLRRQLHLSTYMHKIINGCSPVNFINKFEYISGGSRAGENCNLYTRKSRSHKQFYYLGAKCWNILPQSLRSTEDSKQFSILYKKLLLNSTLTDTDYTQDNAYDHFYEYKV